MRPPTLIRKLVSPVHPTAHMTPAQKTTVGVHVARLGARPATTTRPVSIHLAGDSKAAAQTLSLELAASKLAGFGGSSSSSSSGSSTSSSSTPTAYNAAGIPQPASNPADDYAAGGGMPPATGDDGNELEQDLTSLESFAETRSMTVDSFLDNMTSSPGVAGPRTGSPGFTTPVKVAVGGGIVAGVVALARLLI